VVKEEPDDRQRAQQHTLRRLQRPLVAQVSAAAAVGSACGAACCSTGSCVQAQAPAQTQRSGEARSKQTPLCGLQPYKCNGGATSCCLFLAPARAKLACQASSSRAPPATSRAAAQHEARLARGCPRRARPRAPPRQQRAAQVQRPGERRRLRVRGRPAEAAAVAQRAAAQRRARLRDQALERLAGGRVAHKAAQRGPGARVALLVCDLRRAPQCLGT
jgi:hypothetical protein